MLLLKWGRWWDQLVHIFFAACGVPPRIFEIREQQSTRPPWDDDDDSSSMVSLHAALCARRRQMTAFVATDVCSASDLEDAMAGRAPVECSPSGLSRALKTVFFRRCGWRAPSSRSYQLELALRRSTGEVVLSSHLSCASASRCTPAACVPQTAPGGVCVTKSPGGIIDLPAPGAKTPVVPICWHTRAARTLAADETAPTAPREQKIPRWFGSVGWCCTSAHCHVHLDAGARTKRLAGMLTKMGKFVCSGTTSQQPLTIFVTFSSADTALSHQRLVTISEKCQISTNRSSWQD